MNIAEDKNYDSDMGLNQHDIINDAERVIKEVDTFSSDYISRKGDTREIDESTSQSDTKKVEYDVKIGNLNNR